MANMAGTASHFIFISLCLLLCLYFGGDVVVGAAVVVVVVGAVVVVVVYQGSCFQFHCSLSCVMYPK